MSILDDILTQKLEIIKLEAESPVEKSLRLELKALDSTLQDMRERYRKKCADCDALFESIRYQVTSSNSSNPGMPRLLDSVGPDDLRIAIEVRQAPMAFGTLHVRTQMDIEPDRMMDADPEHMIRYMAETIAHQLMREVQDTLGKGPNQMSKLSGSRSYTNSPLSFSTPQIKS